MVKTYKLHKIAGISAGIILFLLSVSGFFLDHDRWSFLYTTTFSSVPSQTYKSEKKLFTSYYQDKNNPQHIVIGSHRGLFERFSNAEHFSNVSNLQILAMIPDEGTLYLATSDGVYSYEKSYLKKIALDGEYITSLSISKDKIVAVIDQEVLVVVSKQSGKILQKAIVAIDKKFLQEDIKLSRLIRDVHYGRGLLDEDMSLFINDYGAIILTFLAASGYLIWFLIKKKKYPKIVRKLIKLHANMFVVIAVFPLVLLSITGIFLDHSSALAKFMKSVNMQNKLLPPVYHSLKSDIWSVDFDGKDYRIGNRYGIYKSDDLKNWILENKGFAYKMIRKGDALYISGMGVPNRVFKEKRYSVLPKTPHMFRDIIDDNGIIKYFSLMHTSRTLPSFDDITLYTLLLTIHDGTFFSSWWIWINDFAAVMLIVLCITGIIRWRSKSK